MQKDNAQLSLILPPDINTRVRQDAARRGLSVAAYIRVILATGQAGGDISTFFSLPSPPHPIEAAAEHPERQAQPWQ